MSGRAAPAAGPEDLGPHDLRHSAASPFAAGGAGAGAVHRVLGHASAAMTLDSIPGSRLRALDDLGALPGRPAVEDSRARWCREAACSRDQAWAVTEREPIRSSACNK